VTCENCGNELTKPKKGRPQTRFCSRECKEAVRAAEKSAAIAAAKIGRTCALCAGPISETVNLRAKTCSRECGVTYQNRRRQEGKRAVWLANKPPCGRCGGEIPESRPAGSLYCSPKCKSNTLGERWRAKAPNYNRERLYGLTQSQYDQMLTNQDGRCAICRTDVPGGRGTWHVDHCHTTGKIRGLLCSSCNVMLGHAKDDVDRLRAAITYLEAHA
jgi:predicted nucleic acid-binding Zn ribbon protein